MQCQTRYDTELYYTTQEMRTPIMTAGLHDNAEAIETLVASGVEVDAKDDVSEKI